MMCRSCCNEVKDGVTICPHCGMPTGYYEHNARFNNESDMDRMGYTTEYTKPRAKYNKDYEVTRTETKIKNGKEEKYVYVKDKKKDRIVAIREHYKGKKLFNTPKFLIVSFLSYWFLGAGSFMLWFFYTAVTTLVKFLIMNERVQNPMDASLIRILEFVSCLILYAYIIWAIIGTLIYFA